MKTRHKDNISQARISGLFPFLHPSMLTPHLAVDIHRLSSTTVIQGDPRVSAPEVLFERLVCILWA